MSEYRTTATLTTEGTFVVPSPIELPEGTEAEIVVRLSSPIVGPLKHPLTAFLDELRLRAPVAGGANRTEAAQASLRDLREEWD